MTVFTVIIIIWVIYQLGISLISKGKQHTPRKFPEPFKLPDGRLIREALQETPQGSWREQMQQALKNTSRQVEEWTVHADPLKSAESKDIIESYIQTEGKQRADVIQRTGITQGTKGTGPSEGTQVGVTSGIEEILGEGMPRGGHAMGGTCFSISKKELVQGVIWAEILGKPRGLYPFRGPRS